jgi:hypothetical protein
VGIANEDLSDIEKIVVEIGELGVVVDSGVICELVCIIDSRFLWRYSTSVHFCPIRFFYLEYRLLRLNLA